MRRRDRKRKQEAERYRHQQSSSSSNKKRPRHNHHQSASSSSAAAPAAVDPAKASVTVVGKKKSEFLCPIRFRTQLPGPALGPRMLKYPFPPNFLTRYSSANLELNRKHEVYIEPRDAVPINVVDKNAYRRWPNGDPSAEDLELLAMTSRSQQDELQAALNAANFVQRGSLLSSFEGTMYKKGEKDISFLQPRLKPEDEKAIAGLLPEDIEANPESWFQFVEDEFANVDETVSNLKPPKEGVTMVSSMPVVYDEDMGNTKHTNVLFFQNPLDEVRKKSFVKNKRVDGASTEEERSMGGIGKTAAELGSEAMLLPKGSSVLMYVPDESEGDLDRLAYVCEFVRSRKDVTDPGHQTKYFFTIDDDNQRVVYSMFSREQRFRVRAAPKLEDDDKRLENFPKAVELNVLE